MANSQVKQDRPWLTLGSILDMWLGVIIECGFGSSAQRDSPVSLAAVCRWRGSFQLSGWGVAKCFGIGEILRRAQNREGGVTLECGVIFH
jgi:hypothetical protein